MIPLNDLTRGFDFHQEEVSNALLRVARSGWYVQGPEHDAFQDEFATFIGVGHCVGVGNGTDALELAIRAIGVGREGSVLTAANAGGYTTTAALRAGRRVVFADVDPEHLCLTRESIESRLDGVAICVVTHLYGRMAPVEEIVELCHSRGISVIEDCAQSIGAERAGRRAGSIGDVATFSFYPTKNLGALGDAGAVVTSDAEVANLLIKLRQYGWSTKYSADVPGGRNSRLDEMQAAVLRTRLPYVSSWNERRRGIIERYAAASIGSNLQMLGAKDVDHAGHLAVGLTTERAKTAATLLAAGVQTGVHYPIPDHQQRAFQQDGTVYRLPVTEAASQQVISLPCFVELNSSEIDRVCDAIRAL